jgi:hypothetical protein
MFKLFSLECLLLTSTLGFLCSRVFLLEFLPRLHQRLPNRTFQYFQFYKAATFPKPPSEIEMEKGEESENMSRCMWGEEESSGFNDSEYLSQLNLNSRRMFYVEKIRSEC